MRVDSNNQVQETDQTSEANLQSNAQRDADIEPPQTDAGQASRLGELQNRGQQIRQRLESSDVAAPSNDFAKEATVTSIGSDIVIDAGAGDDKIGVTQDAKGNVVVSVNGQSKTFSGADRDHLVIRAGDGNDSITVGKGVAVQLRIEGGAGNDTIEVDKNVKAGQKIFGNDGDDKIQGGGGNDKIEAGAGNDTVDGGAGDDYINGSTGDDKLYGGAGNDVVYGGDGKDTLQGNAGDDYLEGGKGDDSISGGAGKDVVSGGIGDDALRGDEGDDVVYAGQGKDTIYGGKGHNTIYSQKDDAVKDDDENPQRGIVNTVVTVELKGNPGGTSVVVKGSDEFKERVEQDLEMLRSSPTGRKMLEGFDQAHADTRSVFADLPFVGGAFNQGVTVTIQEHNSDSGSADWANRLHPSAPQPFIDPKTGANGTPNNATINYKPSYMPIYTYPDGDVPSVPSVVMFHEMAHAYDFTHGTLNEQTYNGVDGQDNGISNSERVAVGLPVDHDNNPKTPEQTDAKHHPDNLTEDALRREMNLKRREHYAGGKSRV